MSEFMISVNSRARGKRRQLSRTKKKGALRVRSQREDWSGLRNLHRRQQHNRPKHKSPSRQQTKGNSKETRRNRGTGPETNKTAQEQPRKKKHFKLPYLLPPL